MRKYALMGDKKLLKSFIVAHEGFFAFRKTEVKKHTERIFR